MAVVHAAGRRFLLTYCTNVHAGETLAEIERSLDRVTVKVARAVFRDQPMGTGLWLPAGVVAELRADASRLAAFRDALEARGLFAFTLNAFPIAGFHETRVKEKVFEPSWADARRLDYTIGCAEVLAALLPDGVQVGSISTVPLGLRASVGAAARAAAVENLRRLARALAEIEDRTERRIVLALEPEPRGALETIDEAIAFLTDEVFAHAGAGERVLRRHLGVCLDACHEAVMHRDAADALARLDAAGIAVGKVQVTAALELADPAANEAGFARLAAFDEERYFHQVGAKDTSGAVRVFSDLQPFLTAKDDHPSVASARVHFHVPVFADAGGGLSTTRRETERLLAAIVDRARGGDEVQHLEVETYTFDVIPPEERRTLGAETLDGALAKELQWVLGKLGTS